MALFKSFICPLGRHTSQQFVSEILNREVLQFDARKLKCYEKHFTTSVTKNSGRGFKNLKPPKTISSSKLLENAENVQSTSLPPNSLLKPFVFTVAFSSASLAATAIWQYENVRKKAMFLMKKNWLSEKIIKFDQKRHGWRQKCNQIWNQLTEGEKIFVPICFINVLVFLAWKVKRFQPTMIKYFCSTPFSEVVCLPMVLTAFSHYNFLHLALNMYVLHSFSTSGVDVLGKEQFLGLYLTAAVFSSFTSYLFKVIKSQHSLSIGASGAIMAMVAYICARYPDTKLSIVFLPMILFPAGAGIKVIMGLDILGVIRGWKYFDHAAHLGGAFCGIVWCYWGNTYIWQKREPLLHWWHEIRSHTK